MRRNNIKTTIQEIVEYWFERVDECDLNVDYDEAHERCWRCGSKQKIERCHIIPDSRGGEDKAFNYV